MFAFHAQSGSPALPGAVSHGDGRARGRNNPSGGPAAPEDGTAPRARARATRRMAEATDARTPRERSLRHAASIDRRRAKKKTTTTTRGRARRLEDRNGSP